MQRLDRCDRSDAVLLAPGKKFLHCAAKGVARGQFADVRDEKFPRASGRAGGLSEDGAGDLTSRTSWFMAVLRADCGAF
jgi:hypothetical protein